MNNHPPTDAPEVSPFAGSFFSGTWHTFKTNYGLCLGMAMLLFVVTFVVTIATEGLGFFLAAKSGSGTGLAVANILSIAIQVFLFLPLAYWIAMRITQRVRGTSGIRAGWYARTLPLISLYVLLMVPGLIVAALADPDHYHQNNNPIVQIQNAMEAVNAEDGPAAPTKEIDPNFRLPNVGMQLAGGALVVVGLFFALPWIPWATMSALDPEESTSGAGECLARGRDLGRGRAGGIIGSYVLVILIVAVSFAACFFPGVFFGFPLAVAWTPAVYLSLRGG